MFRKATPLFLICETPLHAGSGSDLGVIDLPIQRERHTSFPKIEASSLKGSLRNAFENEITNDEDRKKIHLAFGYDSAETNDNVKSYFKDNEQFQGALGFTDARLLLFPVKSMKGVFAWITCPRVLKQFERDLSVAGHTQTLTFPNSGTASSNSILINSKKAVLEEYAFDINIHNTCTDFADQLAEVLFPSTETSNKYWHDKLISSLIVLQDDDFTDFVNLSTEVITRTKINNETGTVASGALFTEEYLPAESVMYSLALFSPIFHNDTVKSVFINGQSKQDKKTQSDFETNAVESFFRTKLPQIVQIGGNATLGKGLVRTKVLQEEKKNSKNSEELPNAQSTT